MSNNNNNTANIESYATKIANLTDGEWVVLEGTIIELWDNEHPAISQVGIIGDETGIVKFVVWKKSNQPLIQEGGIYRITSLPVSIYKDRYQVSVNTMSVIERIGTKTKTKQGTFDENDDGTPEYTEESPKTQETI